MDWIAQRAKAFVAALVVAVVMAAFKAFEQSFGINVSDGLETSVIDFLKGLVSPDTLAFAAGTGTAVYAVPNKKP